MALRIHVDNDRCTGHGVCEAIAPDVFEVQDDASLVLLVDEPGEELRETLLEAATACPAAALRIEG
jgi:ferredoxin